MISKEIAPTFALPLAVLDRRRLGIGLAAVLASPALANATIKAHARYRDFDGGLPGSLPQSPFPMVRGIQKPEASESEMARAILARAPKVSPLAIMTYFEHLATLNRDGQAYNGGWETRWNPVIVAFFTQTNTVPAGDTTSWCAASLNWALARAGYAGGTHSASSGSFRRAPGATARPRPGDIVVFQATDPVLAAQGRGHVGLFVAQRPDAVLVLGGNQTNAFGHHTVCRKWLDKSGVDLKLHSFHRIGAKV